MEVRGLGSVGEVAELRQSRGRVEAEYKEKDKGRADSENVWAETQRRGDMV